MNIRSETERRTARIRALNDNFRRNLFSPLALDRVLFTPGVAALPHDALAELLMRVCCFEDFTPENDPWQEHDFGALDFRGTRYFWKIDYYATDNCTHSPAPDDPAQTHRTLTIMHADEY